MTCKKCGNSYKDTLAIFSLEKFKLCPDCYRADNEAKAIEEAKKTFEVELRYSSIVTIKADDEDEAIEIATEDFSPSDLYAYAREVTK